MTRKSDIFVRAVRVHFLQKVMLLTMFLALVSNLYMFAIEFHQIQFQRSGEDWAVIHVVKTEENNPLQQHKDPISDPKDPTIRLPRICENGNENKHKNITWVMFMGDSNMRHTYFWWTYQEKGNRIGVNSSTFGLDRRDLDFGGRWADQEYLFPAEQPQGGDQSIVRYSFRFLHGSVTELVHDAQYWSIARRAAPEPRLDDVAREVINQSQHQDDGDLNSDSSSIVGDSDNEDSSMWEGRIRPSDFALWATKHQQPIDDNSKEFDSLMKQWGRKSSPDVVIITQGWGGVPRSDEIEIVKRIVQNNPETLFIWSPLYVTDRNQDRYDSYVESGVFSWSESNLRMVDLWDIAKTLPKSGMQHVQVGGHYMKNAMKRIWNEVRLCTKEDTPLP